MLIGQNEILSTISKLIKSRKNINFPHVLFSGSAGCGKTSLAKYIAEKLNRKIICVNGATVKSISDIGKCLFSVSKYDILFIDEIHRLNINCQETLYPVFDNFEFHIFQQTSMEPVSISLPEFTIFGATTKLGKLSSPFLSRFDHIFEIGIYSDADIAEIIKLESNIDIDAEHLALYSRGVPRMAIMLTQWIQDYCFATNNMAATKHVIDAALKEKGIHKYGLTNNDIEYIKLLASNIGQPVGINTISSSLNLDSDTIQTVIEPFLLAKKIIFKTSKGRVINTKYIKEFIKNDK